MILFHSFGDEFIQVASIWYNQFSVLDFIHFSKENSMKYPNYMLRAQDSSVIQAFVE